MRFSFLKECVRDIATVGSATPSSRFLTRAMLQPVAWDKVQYVVELGPGTGVMTREMLKRLTPGARLTAFEINTTFAQILESISDPRFFLKQQSAWDMALSIPPQSVDAVISGLPLTHFSHAEVATLMRAISTILRDGGMYIQFQYAPLRYADVQKAFPSTHMIWEWRNFPPACVYIATQRNMILPVHEDSQLKGRFCTE